MFVRIGEQIFNMDKVVKIYRVEDTVIFERDAGCKTEMEFESEEEAIRMMDFFTERLVKEEGWF